MTKLLTWLVVDIVLIVMLVVGLLVVTAQLASKSRVTVETVIMR